MHTTTIILPKPPSVNSSYLNIRGRGRVATASLKAWKKRAGWEIVLQKPCKFSGRVTVEISVRHDGTKRKSDIDNRIKATLDLLVEHGIIKDDSLVQRVSAEWVEPGSPHECVVVISNY